MKRTFLLVILFLTLVSLPIYAATRLLLPGWLKEQIVLSLPLGTELSIGEISSLHNLAILYKDVVYQTPSYKMDFDEFLIEPRVDINAPLVLKVKTLKLSTKMNKAIFRNLEIRIVFPDISFDDVLLDGYVSQIEGPYKSILFDSKFIFNGITKVNKVLSFKVEKFSSEIITPAAILKLSGNELDSRLNFSNDLLVLSQAKDLDLEVILEDSSPMSRVLKSEDVKLDFQLVKTDLWSLPLKFQSKSISTPRGHVVDSTSLHARGRWNDASISCSLSDILKFDNNCGKMIDVLDLVISLKDKNGKVIVNGTGFCVAPRSGCRQRLNSNISSKSTPEIFSQLMSSGFINPLVGGVVLGGLLGSPSNENSDYDHSVKIEMIGSKILLNGKSLM